MESGSLGCASRARREFLFLKGRALKKGEVSQFCLLLPSLFFSFFSLLLAYLSRGSQERSLQTYIPDAWRRYGMHCKGVASGTFQLLLACPQYGPYHGAGMESSTTLWQGIPQVASINDIHSWSMHNWMDRGRPSNGQHPSKGLMSVRLDIQVVKS